MPSAFVCNNDIRKFLYEYKEQTRSNDRELIDLVGNNGIGNFLDEVKEQCPRIDP